MPYKNIKDKINRVGQTTFYQSWIILFHLEAVLQRNARKKEKSLLVDLIGQQICIKFETGQSDGSIRINKINTDWSESFCDFKTKQSTEVYLSDESKSAFKNTKRY